MENEKELRNRLKEFLNRYNDSHEKKNQRNIEENSLNQKIEEIERDLSTSPKKGSFVNKSSEISNEKSKNPEKPKVIKNENQQKCENSEGEKKPKCPWEFVVKSNQKSEEKVKRNIFNIERLMPKAVTDFDTNSSGKKPENSHKFKVSERSPQITNNKLKKTPKKKKNSMENVQKKTFYPNKSMKNPNNLTLYGLDTKILEKMTKSSYKEEVENPNDIKLSKSASNRKERTKKSGNSREKKDENIKKPQKNEKNKKNIEQQPQHIEEKAKKSHIEKPVKSRNEETPQKSDNLFPESSQKIENLRNHEEFPPEFKNEVSELITLIKKEKQVILSDISALTKQMTHFKSKYYELKDKTKFLVPRKPVPTTDRSMLTEDIITYEKEVMTSMRKFSASSEKTPKRENNTFEKPVVFDESTQFDGFNKKYSIKEAQTDRGEESTIDAFQIRQSVAEIKMKTRHSMMRNKKESVGDEEYNIYGNNSDKVDEEKIKAMGNLLTTMNMDNSNPDYSIMDTLSELNKDDFMELQHMIIQRLIDNFNVEKNEKECIEQQMLNKDRDFIETKTRLEDRIKILEARLKNE